MKPICGILLICGMIIKNNVLAFNLFRTDADRKKFCQGIEPGKHQLSLRAEAFSLPKSNTH